MEDEGFDFRERKLLEREETVKTEPLTDFYSPENVNQTMVEFLLKAEVPESERGAFKRFAVMFNQVLALTNIEKYERVEWILAMKQIAMLQNFGDYDTARELMAEYLCIAQISRSIKGMNMLYGMQGVTRTTVEHLEIPKPQMETPVRQGILGRLVSGLRGKK